MKTLRADFVIVGGGTAGCVLAERLSDDRRSTVIVLEAGPRHRSLKLHIPGAISALYEEAAYHWPYVSAVEPYAGNKPLPYKMGRLVGGSSAINGMVWVRGNPKDFDDWAAAGNPGWDYASMAGLFRRIESFEDDTDADMGLHGHTVSRIELEDGVATGVIGMARGEQYRVIADREVILSAGSIASPQLLEVSGIGDPDYLTAANVLPTHVLRGVGHNLHTHPTIKLTYGCSKPVSIYPATRPLGRLLAGVQWILCKSGPAATSHFEAGAFLRSHPGCDRPDYQLTFLPLALQGTTGAIKGHGFQIYAELIGCKSRGHTHICSGDIGRQPAFVMNYLQDARDIAAFTEAVHVMRKVVSQNAFQPFRGAEIEPGAQVSMPRSCPPLHRATPTPRSLPLPKTRLIASRKLMVPPLERWSKGGRECPL
jgi:choline dehydrogenase-like flavoprotein